MKEISSNIMNNIGTIFDYAKQNYRNEKNYNQIEESTNILKLQLKK